MNMKYNRSQCAVGSAEPCLIRLTRSPGIITAALLAAVMCGASALAQAPAANASKKPAPGSTIVVESPKSKPDAVSRAPNISGRWKVRSWLKGAAGDFNEIHILQSDSAPGDFRLIPQQPEPSADEPLFSIPIKWVIGTRKFEATYTSPQTSHKISMQLARGGQTMRVTITVDEATKEAFAGRGMSESEIDELLNQEWTLIPQPLPHFVNTEKAAVPDITGEWSIGPKGEYGKAVIRSQGDSTTFVIDQLNKKGQIARHARPQELKWVPGTGKGTGQFEGVVLDADGKSCGQVIVKLQADNATLSYRVRLDEQARQKILADSGLTNEELDATTDLVWKRLSPPGNEKADQSRKPKPVAEEPQSSIEKVLEPTERMDLVQGHAKLVVCRSGIERTVIADQTVIDVVQISPREFNVIGRAAGSTTLALWFEKRFEHKTEPLIYLVNVVRERSATGVEIAAAKPLAEQLAARESAAAAEAATFRQLQASGAADKNKTAIAEHQRQLTSLLNAAFDVKLQLEELQVQELQTRLSLIDRQIGQRKQLREKIIARRAAQLVDGEALQWTVPKPRASAQDENQADTPQAQQKPIQHTETPATTGPFTSLAPNANRSDASAAPPPSTEKLREQLQPFTERIADLQARVQEAETAYFRDRAKAPELQRLWDELCAARAELRQKLIPVGEIISELNDEMEESRKVYDALTQQYDSKIELIATGQATEAEVKAASVARKRIADAMIISDSRIQDYRSTLGALSPAGFDDAQFYRVTTDARPSYDSINALAWLEASLELKLEFVRFDDLKLPCKAALRVREASGGGQTGDLLVSIHGRRFESLDEAVAAHVDATMDGFSRAAASTILHGGLAGQAGTVHFRSSQDRSVLTPSAGSGVGSAIVHFEIRVRQGKGDQVTTAYPQGVCLSLDGLVAVPISAKSLVEGERIVVYSETQTLLGTASVVAADEKHALTLMKLECPNHKLHGWVKCSRTLPALNQRLYFVYYASPTQLHVTAVGQKYDPPREGNDAFLVDRKDEVPNGLPYMSLDDELQGVVLSAPGGKLANCCLPAVHIRKLLDNYRASESAGSGK